MEILIPTLIITFLVVFERILATKIHKRIQRLDADAKSFHHAIFFKGISWGMICIGSVLFTMFLIDPPNILVGKILAPLFFISLITIGLRQLLFTISISTKKLIISSILLSPKIYLSKNLVKFDVRSYSGTNGDGSVVYILDFGHKKKGKNTNKHA